MKHIVILTGTLTLCLFSVGFGLGQANRKVLTAQEIRLTDRSGKARVIVSVSPADDTPSFKLLDRRGVPQISLSLDSKGGVHLTGLPVSTVSPTAARKNLPSPRAPSLLPTPSSAPLSNNIPPIARDSKDVIQTDVPASLQFLKAKVKNGLEADRRIGFGACKIECQVKNISSKSVSSILIKANFSDRTGQFLGEEIAFMGSLGAGEIWKFDIASDNNNAAVGKIVAIQAQE